MAASLASIVVDRLYGDRRDVVRLELGKVERPAVIGPGQRFAKPDARLAGPVTA